jgi:peptidoglycan/LPS O-acetylase OafA/YrhL
VISGYLITRNIWTEIEAGEFSLRAFYLRRIRRIAPAFLVMTAITLAVGCFLLLPGDLRRLAASAASASVAASNVYFWRSLDTGYFAESSDQEPLLHTWTLGVEEQFYVLWPAALLLVALVSRSRRVAFLGALAIFLASFAIGQLTLSTSPRFAYFMLPARAGELMAGALLVLAGPLGTSELIARLVTGRALLALREVLGAVGLGLIAIALVQLSSTSAFPGLNALYPTVGAALAIVAGGLGSRLVRILLTPRPMVFVGLISYSLYLWHWPILAFLRYFFTTLELPAVLVAVALMFGLAIASYRFIEQPARLWRPRPRAQVIRLFAAPASAIVAVALVIVATDGLKPLIESTPEFAAALARAESATRPALAYPYNCQRATFEAGILADDACVLGARPAGSRAATEPDILLWGDSQAAQYVGLLGALAEHLGVQFRNASFSACPPLFGGDWSYPPYRAGCDRFRALVESALEGRTFATVIMGGEWVAYDRDPDFRPALQRTVRSISSAGVRVVLLAEVPIFPDYDRQCPARTMRLRVVDCRRRAEIADAGDFEVNSYVADLATRFPNVSFVSIRDLICRDGRCAPYLGDEPVYFNSSHLSMEGSWRLGGMLAGSPVGEPWLAALAGR